ncbi:lipocalin family protein [Massilia brevitalea]|uniref:lipocalin family protein n=1 Tax=Massilia brevitalea TaxID=442526 RepID=UPI0027388585|nr:lipocalin family protein [Massilia brevitalea]
MKRRLAPTLVKGTVLASLIAVVGMKAYAAGKAAASDLEPVRSLDLARYMGAWYEIARYPNRFERDCAGFTTATYTAMPSGRVKVENRCRTPDGGTDVATGVARQCGPSDSPRLKVRFAPALLSFLPPVWGDYWVIDIDRNYELAAVSEPGRDYLWILSRTPQVEKRTLDALLARLSGQGFDMRKLVYTPQE